MLEHGTTRSSPPLPSIVSRPALEGTPSEEAPPLARQPHPLAAAFRSLRHRNYRLYFIGQIVSLTGTWLQTTALMWLSFELTHQSLWPALVAASQVLPTFFFGAWGGALADHVPKRSLLLVTQSILLALALLLAGLALGGTLDARVGPWLLLLIMLGNGAVQAVDFPARLSFVMDMVGRDDLMNAVALNALLFNVARAVGPALAGVLLIWLSPGLCFLLNGLSFVAVLVALGQMDISGSVHHGDGGKGLRALVAGFHYLADKPALTVLILLAGTMAFFGWPFLNLLPALAQETLGADERGYSLMLSATGFGALLAALTVAALGTLERRRTFIGIGITVVVGALLGLSLAGHLYVAAGCCALIGFGLILFFATSQSIVQLSTADHNRGRVMGVWAMVLSGAIPLGGLVAGPAADSWGEPLVLGLQGVLCALAALGWLALLGLWRLALARRG
jgi:MFS family permease